MSVHDAKAATVGGMTVRRALPRRGLRTVGAWCFVDHMGPEKITPTQGLDVGPHPHTGLHTATWLLDGAILHTDSLGSEQLIRPGQLNLMTAGHGIAHAEEASRTPGTLQGIQLWIAQPEEARNGPSAFAHHAQLPVLDLTHGQGTVLVGEFAGASSPACVDTAILGVDADLRRGTSVWELRPDFEYAVYCASGAAAIGTAAIGGEVVREGQLLELGSGRSEVTVDVPDGARLLLLGGEPFPEPLFMWWNFVVRSREEAIAATSAWDNYGDSERFGRVHTAIAPIPAPRI